MPNAFGRKRRSKKEMEALNTKDLMKSMDYGRWDHPTVIKLFKVMRELNDWISGVVVENERPCVHIIVQKFYAALVIGDFCVWNSECDQEENLTFDYCKEALHDEVLKLAAVFEL